MTISVDEDVLRRARIRALERHESVNVYLAQTLKRYADADRSPRSVFASLGDLADKHRSGAQGEGRAWVRDDLHRD